MLDRDLEEAAEQQTVAAMSHKQNLDRLQQIQTLRLEALKEEFRESVDGLTEEYRIEREALTEHHNRDRSELKLIIEQVQENFVNLKNDMFNLIIFTKFRRFDQQI